MIKLVDDDILLPAIAGTARDPQRTCVACGGRRFQIKSDGPNRAWLKCLECGERQPSVIPCSATDRQKDLIAELAQLGGEPIDRHGPWPELFTEWDASRWIEDLETALGERRAREAHAGDRDLAGLVPDSPLGGGPR